MGYDDIPVASFVDPPLTTIRQPMRQVGAMAVTVLLDKIAAVRSYASSRPGRHLLRAELVVRRSIAPPADPAQRTTTLGGRQRGAHSSGSGRDPSVQLPGQ